MSGYVQFHGLTERRISVQSICSYCFRVEFRDTLHLETQTTEIGKDSQTTSNKLCISKRLYKQGFYKGLLPTNSLKLYSNVSE